MALSRPFFEGQINNNEGHPAHFPEQSRRQYMITPPKKNLSLLAVLSLCTMAMGKQSTATYQNRCRTRDPFTFDVNT